MRCWRAIAQAADYVENYFLARNSQLCSPHQPLNQERLLIEALI
ncbi:MAG: hypothetical protein ACYT04_10440 [Nostoc sp.]